MDTTSPLRSRTADDAIVVRMLGPGDAPLLDDADVGIAGYGLDASSAAASLADPHRLLAAALAGDRVVGVALAIREGARHAPGLVLVDVAVVAEHRRRGVGRRLVVALLARGRALGCTHARAEAGRDDIALRRLLAAAGGVEVAEPVVQVSFELA